MTGAVIVDGRTGVLRPADPLGDPRTVRFWVELEPGRQVRLSLRNRGVLSWGCGGRGVLSWSRAGGVLSECWGRGGVAGLLRYCPEAEAATSFRFEPGERCGGYLWSPALGWRPRRVPPDPGLCWRPAWRPVSGG